MTERTNDEPAISGPDGDAVRTVADLAQVLRDLRRRDARRRRDTPLTYRELAAKTGWSHSAIGLYFKGQALPPTDRFDALVQLLGATPAEQRALATARDRIEERRHAEGEGGARRVRRTEPPAAVPHALPAPAPHFTGRAAELEALTGLLRERADSGGTVVISAIGGTAGVGKTALAVHWAHAVADRFPDGQLFVNLRGFDPGDQVMDPGDAVRSFLDALRVPPREIPATLDGQIALYRSMLAGRRMLVVLDNARDAGQVRPLLPGTPGCLVLVTSRNLLAGLVATDGAHPFALDLLTPAEAHELLARRLGDARLAAEPEAVEEILARCARLPLALAIVAAHAATHPGVRLADLAADLRDARRRWDPLTDVRSVFSWSYRTLDPQAARLFRLLGLHPGPDISDAAAASLAGRPVAEVRTLLGELTRAHLVTEHVPGRYALHDLLRAYAVDQAQEVDTADQRGQATARMLDHYVHSAHAAERLVNTHRDMGDLDPPASGTTPERPADNAAALAWFDAEHAVLIGVAQHAAAAGFDAAAWRIVWNLPTYLDYRGHWHDWLVVGRVGVEAAGRLDDPSAQALAHRLLARPHIRLRRYEDTHENLRRALDLYRRAGDVVGQADTHLTLGDLWERQDRHTDALDHARQALALYRAGGHRPGQADALNFVGWCYALLGDHRQAIAHCEESLALHRELGPGIVEATTWDSLGFAHHHLGHHAQAIDCYRKAIDLFVGLGDRYQEAVTLNRLGDTHRAAGDEEAARAAWRRSLDAFGDVDHVHAEEVRAKLG
ncbi:MAG TPA: tetratricopeptide repeat protein [Micromonosporaceae bacterium]|nr:tetratricopeptide repeat protein [Micromonosporaceae bacterium]